MDELEKFNRERSERSTEFGGDVALHAQALGWVSTAMQRKYIYNFDWLGRPIIQFPDDMVAIQELIWKVRPDVIIETGIAHGGSLILSASMLALLEYCDAFEEQRQLDPAKPQRRVVGVDIDIRPHNRTLIEQHPMANRITMIEGSSIDEQTVRAVKAQVREGERVLVFLDSMHTHDHVLAELEAYAGLVSEGSYCVVFDTVVEDLPDGFFADRPWGPGNSPKSALYTFLRDHPEFEIDDGIVNKMLITAAPHGYLKRTA